MKLFAPNSSLPVREAGKQTKTERNNLGHEKESSQEDSKAVEVKRKISLS